MWIGESEVQKSESMAILDGAPPRDLSAYSAWRDEVDPANLGLITTYGSFLAGQFAGMGDALSLPAVQSTMEILNVEREERPEMARRLVLLHGLVRDAQKARQG